MLKVLLLSHSKCLADLCGALHCDLVMNSKTPKAKCNPAAAPALFMQSLADSCFPVNHGLSASRLHGTLVFLKDILCCYCSSTFSCANSVMLILAQEEENLFPEGAWVKNLLLILGCQKLQAICLSGMHSIKNTWNSLFSFLTNFNLGVVLIDVCSLECFICTEAAKYFLPGYFNLDSDDASCVLRYCISVPKRNEKGNPRAEAHLTTWVENKAVLVGQAIGIINQQMGDAHGTFNHKGQLTKVDIRENSSEMVLESQDYHYISNKVGTLIWEEAAKKFVICFAFEASSSSSFSAISAQKTEHPLTSTGHIDLSYPSTAQGRLVQQLVNILE
ncbi:hypothetical protein CK203_055331 [Vitis vinifera]|uniref:Uncharacterized protein n=1 Tax=Vitis vinifera TaxID=29760 RepID=A0A438GSU8_VITVI|nr:hypothetical protein CK203_055331 [Vitis vinifera]